MSTGKRITNNIDPIRLREQQSPELVPMEIVLRKTATLEMGFLKEPFIGSVSKAINRFFTDFNDWSMPEARKEHTCGTCERVIQPRDYYVKLERCGNRWDSDKMCIPCAAKYLLDICEAHRYSADRWGSGVETHWSTNKQEWIRIEENERTSYLWRPSKDISPDLAVYLNAVIKGYLSINTVSRLPNFDSTLYVPWLQILLDAADRRSSEDKDKIWAINWAIKLSRYEGNNRWAGPFRNEETIRVNCFGCGDSISSRKIFRLYGEVNDFLCMSCAAATILTERTEWVLDKQFSDPYYCDIQGSWVNEFDLRKLLEKELLREEQRKYFQAKVDSGLSIEAIAQQEDRKPSTIKQKLRDLKVLFPKN